MVYVRAAEMFFSGDVSLTQTENTKGTIEIFNWCPFFLTVRQCSDFLMISGGIERDQWHQIGLILTDDWQQVSQRCIYRTQSDIYDEDVSRK